MQNKAGDTPDIKIPPPLLFLLPFLAGVLAHHATGGADAIAPALLPALRLVGGAVAAAGIAFNLAGVLAFRRAKTPVIPFKPTTAIVAAGPYRFSRNPIYLGMALVYLGLPLILGYWWPYALFPVTLFLLHRFVIEREERYLEAKFGDEYRAYRSRVRRWL